MNEWLEITEAFETTVAEMSSDPSLLVTLPPDVVAAVSEGDDDPKFATFVIESGWSKSKRYWGPELFNEVAVEMNKAAREGEPIVGYLGHIKPEDDPYNFPEIQLQWLGARLLSSDSPDKARLAVKAYVLPNTRAREYFKRKLVNTVSWRGKVAQELFQQGVRIKKFAIESVDLARPRSAGMSARMVGALTSEMEEGGNSVKPEEIAALQENELRAHNPGLVAQIETAVKQPLETRVSEMETTLVEKEPVTNLLPEFRTVLGLQEDTDDVATMQAVISHLRVEGMKLRDQMLDDVLDKRFKEADPLLRRVIVGEMRQRDLKLTGETDKDEKTVAEMVDEIVNSSEDLKRIVSEMEETPASPPAGERDRGNANRELKAGYKSSSIRVRAVQR